MTIMQLRDSYSHVLQVRVPLIVYILFTMGLQRLHEYFTLTSIIMDLRLQHSMQQHIYVALAASVFYYHTEVHIGGVILSNMPK